MTLLNNQRQNSTTTRRVGLSNKQRAPHLLSTFQASSRVQPPIKKIKKAPKAFDDPPLSSDDEDSQIGSEKPTAPGSKTPQKKSTAINVASLQTSSRKKSELTRALWSLAGDSSSGDELATRGEIKATAFTRTRRSEALQRDTRSKRKDSPAEVACNVKDSDSKKQRTGTESVQRRKEIAATLPSSSGEHLKDSRGFTKIKKCKTTYKKRDHGSQEQETGKGKSRTKSRGLKVPEEPPDSPEKPKANKLRVPLDDIPASPPCDGPAKLKLVPGFEDSGSRPSFKASDSSAASQRSSKSRGRRKLRKPPELEQTPSPPRPVFRIPVSPSRSKVRTIASKGADPSLSNSASDTEMEVSIGDYADAQRGDSAKKAKPAVCPWCGEQVDPNLLKEFSKGKRLNVRQQTRFCQKHKKKTAQDIWQEKEYPFVEWDSLNGRFAQHRDFMLDIIHGSPSHFRSIHELNIESGKARSMKKEGNMNPGYYGPRGFNIMCDYLVEEFGDLLKKKAVDDKVISGRGSAAFIQNVLVAELAVQMIMDDMRATEAEARFILEDSKALGELIHEEV